MSSQFPLLYKLLNVGELEAGVKRAQALLAQQPDNAELHQLLAFFKADQGHVDRAIELLKRATQLDPKSADHHYNLGWLLQKHNHPKAACLSYQKCLRLNPSHRKAQWNLSELLRRQEEFDCAASLLEALLDAEFTEYKGLHHRLAVCYAGMGRSAAARREFEVSLGERELDPHLTRWEYSHLLLASGDLKRGWQAYESRYLFNAPKAVQVYPFEIPRWKGELLTNQRLLIHGEQGLGDQLMFASLVPALINEGAHITLAVNRSLCRLMANSFATVKVVEHCVGKPASINTEQFDFETPIGSLCNFRGPFNIANGAADNVATHYLKADINRQSQLAACLKQLLGDSGKPRVGLVWNANPAQGVTWGQRRSRQKSIPITALKPLQDLASTVDFISLQNVDCALQAADAPWLNILDMHDYLHDMADTAALVNLVDLVVSIDTSVAHLAGGMGAQCLTLLKHRADWRWLETGEACYWYPNTRLLRQTQADDWTDVVQTVHQSIKHLVR